MNLILETILYGILTGMGTFGIVYLITQKDGPFDIFTRIREFDYCAWLRRPYVGVDSGMAKQVHRDCLRAAVPGATSIFLKQGQYKLWWHGIITRCVRFVVNLVSCPFCTGPYACAFILVYLYFVYNMNLVMIPVVWFFGIGVNNLLFEITADD